MSKLVICEKPSVAKSIASALGVTSRADGCFEGNGLIVSWCVGHLVSPMDAAGYDLGYKKWKYDDLPILPEPFRYVLAKGKEDAFQNLKHLMEREDVTELVNACDAGREGELVDRNGVMLAQTPQSFKYDRIMKAYRQAKDDGVQATDDCALYKRLYGSVHYSLGGVINQKLTTEEDIELFQKLTARERIGYGEDTHRLTEGRRLVIGGVEIPYRLGLMGHSDADVLIHAVIDALLGAAAMGDIGRLFPDSSPEYKDMDSLILLKRAWQMVRGAGYEICSVDATVIAQEPKLAPYIDNMRRNIADAMGCDVGIVSAKATTPEHTGPEGNLECITARSVCMIRG
mgnify:CR=1 FL=1